MIFRMHTALILTFLFLPVIFLFPDEDLKASIIIVGPGNPVYTYWGHIGISMENSVTGEKLFYDFGNFSFYSENFYRDFAMGRMIYLGMVTPTDYFIRFSLTKDRTLTSYPLNLGHEELVELDTILRWWVRPENRKYLYDYFRNNCSTIIRDILNDITRGELKKKSEKDQDLNFRHYARTGSAPSFPTEVLLDYLLGSDLDQPITGWEKMFLPQAVADYIMQLQYKGKDGKIRTLADKAIVLRTSSRQPVPDDARVLWPVMLLIGLIAGFIWTFSGLATGRTAKILAGISRSIIILSVGIPGLFLGFLATFTNHSSAYRNINLWPTFPTVLAGLIILSIPAKKKELVLSWIWTINLAGLLLAVFLHMSKIYIQDSYAFWALLAPLTLAASRPGLWMKERLLKPVKSF